MYVTRNDGVPASPSGSQASPEAASCTASSPSVSIPNATPYSFCWAEPGSLGDRALALAHSMAAVKCKNKYPVGVIGAEARAHYSEARHIVQAGEASKVHIAAYWRDDQWLSRGGAFRLKEAVGAIVSMCADSGDVFPDYQTSFEAVTEAVNELYGCIEDGVFTDASAMSAGTAETPVEAAQGEARQRDGEAGTPDPNRPSTPDEMGDAQ